MKYIDAEKLIAEIERRMKDYNASIEQYYNKQKSIKAERDSWKWAECKWFLNLIATLQQEQPEGGCSEKPNNLLREQPSLPSNLDKAAEAYSENILANGEDMFDAIADGFRAGAEWMAGQGEEAEVGYWNQIGLSVRLDKSLERLGFKGGDKVRVQITKI